MGNSLPCCGSRDREDFSRARFLGTTVDVSKPTDSDHNAILFTLGRCGKEPLKLLTWNILCKYGFNEQYGFPFDGFNRKFEGESDYTLRLQRTAKELKAHVESSESPQVILLQECAEPHEFGYGVIVQELADQLSQFGYKILHEGEFVTATLAAGAETLVLPPLRRQSGKIHAVSCGELGCIVLNVHLNWDKQGSENERLSRTDLETIIADLRSSHPQSEIYLAGDTNRVPANLPRTDQAAATIEQLTAGLGDLCFPPGPTNVRWSGDLGVSEMTYADFALRVR
eukprot:TRINITY_DN29562_c0_g1_i1.p1 TRINITY_DN29562_c0_g1~~TRINITY_DN29562_c0_g1_i1.p1  ORF type:complete len:284 (+),score=33.17 TRINITY_DN29562_c0_g1_i1:57-908(+)